MGSLVLLFLFLCLSPPVRADKKEAQRLNREGQKLFRNQKIRAALKKFQEAFQAHRSGIILNNIAMCHERLGNLRDALKKLRRALLYKLPLAYRKKLLKRMSKVTAMWMRMTVPVNISTTPPGARVELDGRYCGVTPLRDRLEPASHQLTLKLKGFETRLHQMDVKAGQDIKLAFTLKEKRAYGRLAISTALKGASIHIDGKAVGVTPLPRPLRLPAKSYAVMLTKKGFRPYIEIVAVEDGRTARVEAVLAPMAVKKPVVKKPLLIKPRLGIGKKASGPDRALDLTRRFMPRVKPSRTLRTLAWTALGVSAAAGVAALVHQLLARKTYDRLQDPASIFKSNNHRNSVIGHMDSYEVQRNVELVAAGLFAAASATLFIVDYLRRRPLRRKTGLRLTLAPLPGGAHLGARVRF